jgi:hypothetical protein
MVSKIKTKKHKARDLENTVRLQSLQEIYEKRTFLNMKKIYDDW